MLRFNYIDQKHFHLSKTVCHAEQVNDEHIFISCINKEVPPASTAYHDII